MHRKAGSSAAPINQIEGESRKCTELKSKTASSSNHSLQCNPPLVPAKAKVGMLSRGNSGAVKNFSHCNSDDTVVVRFVGSALVGRSETEDACHHGLVEPTINTKEAMDAINSMFLEPLEPETMLKRRSKRENPNHNQQASAFDIFVDENEPNGNDPNRLHNNRMKEGHPNFSQQTRGFEIFVDQDGPNGNDQNAGQNRNSDKENVKLNHEKAGFEIYVDEDEANDNVQNAMWHKNNKHPPRPLCDASRHQCESTFQKPFVGGLAILKDDDEEQSGRSDEGIKINSRTVQTTHDNNSLLRPVQYSGTGYHEGSHHADSGLREDTVIHRFVGSTIVDEPRVENACHHGLVEPTINLKEAMDDINNMFGRPLNFKGERTKRKTNALSVRKLTPVSGFSILADDDIQENPTSKANQKNPCKSDAENCLFEPTITTRDVMAEINDMFGMPLDF
ncbi:uncharacterized protein LOC120680264 isoform X2 [Panicum virgatum]|nr:uncharacterized protein LOC120680264 isoform X2 [Panicum virgatum]